MCLLHTDKLNIEKKEIQQPNLIDLAKFLANNDCTLSNIDVAELEEAMKRQEIINNHPHKIWQRGDVWLTYITDETRKEKRRQISAKTLENLENKIYEAYKADTVLTFGKFSEEWKSYYRDTVKETTFSRTMSTYNRFIPKSSLYNKDIRKIKLIDVKKYLQETIRKEELYEQAYKNLKSLLNGIFTYALESEVIIKNPMDGMKVSTAYIKQPEKKEKTAVVFVNKEKELLRNFIKADRANFKTSVPFAILLAFQLALRVSELVALKWTDINKGTIHIQREEIVYDKYDENLNIICKSYHEIKERTKTDDGNRILPLTPEALWILKKVREWNMANGIRSEYIFADKDGKNFNRQRINTKLYDYCEKVGITKKSSHKVRRTAISNLLDTVENKKAVQTFAGHKHFETTINNYYEDTSSDEDFFKGMCACL